MSHRSGYEPEYEKSLFGTVATNASTSHEEIRSKPRHSVTCPWALVLLIDLQSNLQWIIVNLPIPITSQQSGVRLLGCMQSARVITNPLLIEGKLTNQLPSTSTLKHSFYRYYTNSHCYLSLGEFDRALVDAKVSLSLSPTYAKVLFCICRSRNYTVYPGK